MGRQLPERGHHGAQWPADRSRVRIGLVVMAGLLLAAVTAACGNGGGEGPGAEAVAATRPEVLTLDTTSSWTWQGFGTSLGWWANIVGDPSAAPGQLPLAAAASPAATYPLQGCTSGPGGSCTDSWPAAVRTQLLTDLFGDPGQPSGSGAQGVEPLGLNVVRYQLGASPWDLSEVATPLGCGGGVEAPPAGLIPRGKSYAGSFGYGQAIPSAGQGPTEPLNIEWDAAQLSVLRQAVSLIAGQAATSGGAAKAVLQAYAASPPWWLLTDQCPAGGKGDGRFDPGAYAAYLTQALAAYQAAGVDFATVAPFDGPTAGRGAGCTDPAGCREGATAAPGAQQATVASLCGDLTGHTTVTVAADTGAAPDQTTAEVPQLLADNCVTQFDAPGTAAAALVTGAARAQLRQGVPQADTLWRSGAGDGDAAALAAQIADDLQDLRPTAWVYDQPAGPGALVDPTVFGSVPTDTSGLRATTAFQALGQYSRYLRPGSTIYPLALAPGSYDDPAGGGPRATVAVDPSGNIVVVASNTSPRPTPLRLALQPLRPGGSGAAHQLDLASGRTTDGTAALSAAGELDRTLPAGSVTTVVLPPGTGQALPATTTTLPPPPTTTTTAPPDPHPQFVAQADAVCRQAGGQLPPLTRPTASLAALAARLTADQQVLPALLHQEQALVADQPDAAKLQAGWLQPLQQDVGQLLALAQQYLTAYTGGQVPVAQRLGSQLLDPAAHQSEITAFLEGYGLTDCANLEQQ